VVLNKIDKGQVIGREAFGKTPCVSCSLVNPDGARPVVDALETILQSAAVTTPQAMVSERHYRGLMTSLDHVQSAVRILEDDSDDIDSRQPECAAIHLRVALDELGSLTGEKYTEDLLDNVFRKFCIGK
jgi:tRNA modification GTPase